METPTWNQSKERQLQYIRRSPETTELYRIVYHHRNDLEWRWEQEFQPEFGCLRKEVLDALDKYLNCGILAHGCARARCLEPKCNHSVLIAFSCKRRGICPSCATKRALIFAEHLHKELLPAVPQRHVVFSLPKRLRPFFKYDRKHCSLLFQAAWETIKELHQAVLPQGDPGAVLVLQTAGESLNWNPHIHGTVSDGVFDSAGMFHPLGYFSQEKATALFTHKVLKAMLVMGLIDRTIVENILSWQHPGFSVWAGEPIMPNDDSARLFLSRYIDRGPIALKRISITDDIITYDTEDDITHEFSAIEFLARITPHIPDKWESTVRYFGEYSHRRRGQRKKTTPQETTSALPELPDKRAASKTWAALIKKIYEVDPLVCPKCGGSMKIIAFLQDQHEICKILTSLAIPKFKTPPPLRGPPTPEPFIKLLTDDFPPVVH